MFQIIEENGVNVPQLICCWVSCSCTTMPRLTGNLQPRRNWPTWASNVLITHPILRTWPRRTTTRSLERKNNWKVAIFRLTQRSLLPRRPGWTNNLLNYFEWLAKVRAGLDGCGEEKISRLHRISNPQIVQLVAIPCTVYVIPVRTLKLRQRKSH